MSLRQKKKKLAMLPLVKSGQIKTIQCPGDDCEHPQIGRVRSCTSPAIRLCTQGCTLCDPLHEYCDHATALAPSPSPSLGVGLGAAVSGPRGGYLSL